MTYKENAKNYMENYGLGIGDKIKVNKEDISYTGILLDRPEDADDGYLVIKLSSGYNIGVAIENTTAELIEKGEKPKIGFGETEIPHDDSKQNISIVSTGGTVSSVIDYRTGAVHPAFTASDLVKANPELLDYANYNVKALYNILSEDMKPEYWVKAAEEIANDITTAYAKLNRQSKGLVSDGVQGGAGKLVLAVAEASEPQLNRANSYGKTARAMLKETYGDKLEIVAIPEFDNADSSSDVFYLMYREGGFDVAINSYVEMARAYPLFVKDSVVSQKISAATSGCIIQYPMFVVRYNAIS